MKKVLVGVAVLCAAGVLAGGVAANPDAGTIVESGFACGILDGNGNGFTTTNSTKTVYQNKVVMRCVGDGAGAANPIVWNFSNTGLTCGIGGFGSTENWTDKVGRNGNSQLVCTILGDFSANSSGGNGVG